MYLKRFTDVSGTYKIVTAIGFDKFVKFMGTFFGKTFYT
jgi:hypothetical protein